VRVYYLGSHHLIFRAHSSSRYSVAALVGSIEVDNRLVDLQVSAPVELSNKMIRESVDRMKTFVAHSVMSTQASRVNKECKDLRQRFGDDITLIAGGPHASARPRDLLDAGFDYVVVGEGEKALPDLLWHLMNSKDPLRVNGVVSATSQDLSVQLFTGGTTGLPKGTNFTHQALLDACTLIPDHGLKLIVDGEVPESALLPTDHELKFLVPTPLYHLSGFMPAIIMAAMKRPVVFPKSLGFEPQEILELIEREKITALFMVPTQFRMLLDYPELDTHDMTSVTLLSSGGSKMPAYMKKEILNRFPNTVLVDGYGQTENIGAAIYSFLTVDDIPKVTEGYIGKPISGVEMRVINESGDDVSPGEIGEAIYRSPSLMRGYHDDDSMTKDSFDGAWFRTGDLFRIDEEGNYYYVERKSEVIFSGGEKVFPAEVEDLLSQHPDVDSAVIVGIPDRIWGEVVRAFVVLKPGSEITENDILAWCSGKMASYKKPKEVILRDSLPIAEDGKILRSALKELDSE